MCNIYIFKPENITIPFLKNMSEIDTNQNKAKTSIDFEIKATSP